MRQIRFVLVLGFVVVFGGIVNATGTTETSPANNERVTILGAPTQPVCSDAAVDIVGWSAVANATTMRLTMKVRNVTQFASCGGLPTGDSQIAYWQLVLSGEKGIAVHAWNELQNIGWTPWVALYFYDKGWSDNVGTSELVSNSEFAWTLPISGSVIVNGAPQGYDLRGQTYTASAIAHDSGSLGVGLPYEARDNDWQFGVTP